MSAEVHFEALFLNVFFSMLFQMLFLRLRTLFWRFWASILSTLGGFLGAFGYLGSFLRIALPCRRELKNQGPGVTEIAQKSNKPCIWLWDCFGKQVFKEIIQFWYKKMLQKEPQIGVQVRLGRNLNPLFSPLGQHACPSGAQWRPKWLQGCLKAAKMELKCRPRSSKCGSKTSRKKEKQQRKRK